MPNETCKNCGQRIMIQVNRGQKYCSENCRKDLEKNVSSMANSNHPNSSDGPGIL